MATARETAERHIKAALEGKMDVVMGDVMPELHAGLQPLAEKLGTIQPTGHEILEERKEGDQVVIKFKFIGSAGSLTVEDTWALKGDAWKVVKAAVL